MKTPTVAKAIEFAKQSRSDCANMQRIDAILWGDDGKCGASDLAEDSHAIARAALAKHKEGGE